MNYRYFAQQHTEFNPMSNNWSRKPIAIYRINGENLEAERFIGYDNWKLDESGYAVKAFLGIDGVTEYDEITESEVEKLKRELFPETG